MIRFTEQQLRSKRGRKPGYVEAVLAIAVRDGDWLTLSDEQGQELRRQYTVGLGDVIAAATSAVGIKPCPKCKQRQAALNRAVPFTPSGPLP